MLQPSTSLRAALRHDRPAGIAEQLRESARRVYDLEHVRSELARTLLEVQQACATAKDPQHAQRLISAAVRDLEELDARLYEARTQHASAVSGEESLVG